MDWISSLRSASSYRNLIMAVSSSLLKSTKRGFSLSNRSLSNSTRRVLSISGAFVVALSGESGFLVSDGAVLSVGVLISVDDVVICSGGASTKNAHTAIGGLRNGWLYFVVQMLFGNAAELSSAIPLLCHIYPRGPFPLSRIHTDLLLFSGAGKAPTAVGVSAVTSGVGGTASGRSASSRGGLYRALTINDVVGESYRHVQGL